MRATPALTLLCRDSHQTRRRLQKFRTDYAELKSQFDRVKTQASNAVSMLLVHALGIWADRFSALAQRAAEDRSALLGNASGSTSARQRLSAMSPTTSTVSESPFGRAPTPSFGPNPTLREDYALREHSFINNTDSQLDMFIAQGREVLDNLADQRHMLKGTHKRLLDAANTLGLSRSVISWIERRR